MIKKPISLLALVGLLLIGSTGCRYSTLERKQQNIGAKSVNIESQLQMAQQQVRARWANIEAQLQRRADLTNDLFDASEVATINEQQVLRDISEARSRLLNIMTEPPKGGNGDKSIQQKQAVIDANDSFGETIGRWLSLIEKYPKQRSVESFQKFQDSSEGTENRIATARDDYNAAVQDYNATVVDAKIDGFNEEPYFKADPPSAQAPRIDAESVRKPAK